MPNASLRSSTSLKKYCLKPKEENGGLGRKIATGELSFGPVASRRDGDRFSCSVVSGGLMGPVLSAGWLQLIHARDLGLDMVKLVANHL
jgi:hypothetical protein